jgi:hypothetical protein
MQLMRGFFLLVIFFVLPLGAAEDDEPEIERLLSA